MSNKEPKFDWNDTTGIAIYTLYDDKNRSFIGVATCAKEDSDMKSEKTGFEIASRRAEMSSIKQHIKDLKNENNILKNLYKTYQTRPDFNKENPYVKILGRKIYNTDLDILSFKNILKQYRYDLESLIRLKDGFYKKVRKAREQALAVEHPTE